MTGGMWKELAAVTAFLVVTTAVIAWSGADLSISAQFSMDGKWTVGYLPVWQAFYRMDRIPAIALGMFGLAAFLVSFSRLDLRQWRLPGAFLVILLVVGPGLLVNAVFKDHWGRPRPREIVQFGGQKQFSPTLAEG